MEKFNRCTRLYFVGRRLEIRKQNMTSPRKDKICLDATSFYHCISRCVRRSFLCGVDKVLKKNYNHRRAWIEERLLTLSEWFCINVVSYAVMSNHYHVILQVNKDHALSLSDQEVALRWSRLCKFDELTKEFIRGEKLSKRKNSKMKNRIKVWRERLYSISWFMKMMNEYVSRRANKEDKLTGAFWESRFKSQALLDEKALLACMAYVDLNPVRAGMSKSPEESEHTSINCRLHNKHKSGQFISSFGDEDSKNDLPFSLALEEYVGLLRWTAENMYRGINEKTNLMPPKVIEDFSIEQLAWFKMAEGFENQFKLFAGPHAAMNTIYNTLHRKQVGGIKNCRELFRKNE